MQKATSAGITRWHTSLLILTAVLLYLLVTLGGIVCVTESSKSCPDWPLCYGQIVPPLQINSILEYVHRVVALLATPLILACAAAGWIKARPIRWIAWPPFISLPFLIAVVIFGALAVLTGLPPWLAAIDLGSALLIQALLTAAAAAAVGMRVAGVVPTKLAYRTAFSRLAALALAAVYLTLVSAPLAAGSGSPTRCLSFPLWAPNPADPAGFPLVARWLLSLLAGGLILASLALRRSAPFLHPAVRKLSTLTAILFFAQAALGILISVTGFSVGLMIPYIAIAAALWGGMVALAVMAGFLTA